MNDAAMLDRGQQRDGFTVMMQQQSGPTPRAYSSPTNDLPLAKAELSAMSRLQRLAVKLAVPEDVHMDKFLRAYGEYWDMLSLTHALLATMGIMAAVDAVDETSSEEHELLMQIFGGTL